MRVAQALTGALAMVALAGAACGDGERDSAGVTDGKGAPSSGETTDEVSSVPADESVAPAGVAIPVSEDVGRAEVNPDAPVAELVAGWNDAGFELMRRLPAGENVVFSPASIGHALLIAEAAGDEETRAAIGSAFRLPQGAHDAWNRIDADIVASQSEQVTVTVADRIWPRAGLVPDQEWVDLIASRHGVDVVPLNYTDAEQSRQTINDWVSERTEELIPELFSEPLSPDTVLVLTDALYFKAAWADTPTSNTFIKYGPVPGIFTTYDGDEVDVSFMQELELEDRRGVGDGFVGAEIPYAGNDYSMLVLVPDAGRYDEFLDRLDQDLLDEIDETFTTGPYELLVPKWDDDYRIELLDWLEELGVAPGAFPAIAPGAFLGEAVHAADIAVDEYGTVAAAATGLEALESGPPEPELTVAADRPFVYLIRHRPTGLVLFAGHVTDPTI